MSKCSAVGCEHPANDKGLNCCDVHHEELAELLVEQHRRHEKELYADWVSGQVSYYNAFDLP